MNFLYRKTGCVRLNVVFPLLIFLCALTVRTIYLNQVSDSPFFSYRLLDDDMYHEHAISIIRGSWPGDRVHFKAPLYSYFLALLYTLFGQGIFTIKFLQAILGALSCVLVYFIGIHLFGNKTTALIAALICCLCGPMVYFDGVLLPANLDVFLQMLLLLTLVVAVRDKSYRWWIAAGVIAGLSAVNRGSILLFIPFVLVSAYILFRISGIRGYAYLKCMVVFLFFMMVAIFPITYHNFKNDIIPHLFDYPLSNEKPQRPDPLSSQLARLFDGRFVLISSNAGINFYLGNHYGLRDVNATSHPEHFNVYRKIFGEPYRKGFRYPSEQNRYLVTRTLEDIVSDPLSYGKLLGLKMVQWFNGAEIPRNMDPYPERQHSSLLTLLLWKYLIAFPSGLLIPLGLTGIFLCFRSYPDHLLLFGFLVSQFIFIMLFFVTSRYRLPSLPILAIYTSYTLERFYLSIKQGKMREIMVPTLGALLLVIISNASIGKMPSHQSAYAYCRLGNELAREGDISGAINYYRRSIEIEPSLEFAHKELQKTEHYLNGGNINGEINH